jgi:FMN phosphatase YigB (HAD superfamily)
LDKSNAVPEKTMFVEDTLANLKPAKDNGVKTVYLHHDRPLDGANTAFVDLIVKDTPELLRHMASLGQAA